MRRAGAAIPGVLIPLLLAAAGCRPCPETVVSLHELVAEYNANADAVPRLWARADMSVTIDVKDALPFTWRSGGPTCLLLLAKGKDRLGAHDFALLGRETAAVVLFRIGSSAEQGLYYFWFQFGDRAGAWYGLHDAALPRSGRLPIDPMQLLSVLGVCPLPDEPGRLPAVALGMQNTPGDCAYVVAVVDRPRGARHMHFRREVYFRWSDTEPRRPYQVNLFDAAGRRVMTARLKRYRPIDVSELDDPPDVEPVMPTDIEIVANRFGSLPTSVRRIHLVLSEMTAADKWDRSVCRFDPPDGIVPVRVDRAVGGARAGKPKGGPSK